MITRRKKFISKVKKDTPNLTAVLAQVVLKLFAIPVAPLSHRKEDEKHDMFL